MLARFRQALTGSRFATAEVIKVQHLSPHMIRVTLKGAVVESFSSQAAGGHFKMIVPAQNESPTEFERLIGAGNFKAAMRTYTIRHIRPSLGELDVDIVTHGDLGRVGPWAQRAKPGDQIVISRCGSPKLITQGVTHILAAADMTGFPALAAGLETLPETVKVDAFVEILSENDRQPVQLPTGVAINWIVNSDPNSHSAELIDAIRSADTPGTTSSVFVAGEFSAVADLRNYFRNEIGMAKDRLYISSYWKAGLNEPAHKIAKAAA